MILINEWGSSSTHYDYGFRIYNPAIAKFLSVDPLTRDFPDWSPYAISYNNPNVYVDKDGRFPQPVIAFFVGAFLETTFQIAEQRFVQGTTWKTAIKNVNKTDVIISASVVSVSDFFDGGASTLAARFSKARNRRLFAKTLSAAGEVIMNSAENALKQYYGDEYESGDGINLTEAIIGGIVETGIGKSSS